MPAQKKPAATGLMAKYGAKLDSAVKTHADDPVDYGFIPLPPGIRGGIAQLEKCYFDQYKTGKNQGEYYFRAEGVIIEPESVVDGKTKSVIPVRGLHTSIMEPVCNTAKADGTVVPQDEHIANILNEMKKLGAETAGATGADLEGLAESLQTASPYFRFATSQSAPTEAFPDPRVWENWNGTKGMEGYEPSGNGQLAPAAQDESGPQETQMAAPPASSDGVDLAALGKAADNGDADAATQIAKIAEDAGVMEADIKAADNWLAVVGLIEAVQGGNPDVLTAPEPEVEWKPAKGDVYRFKPMVKGPGGKMVKGKKAVEIDITAVDLKNKKVNGLNNTDRKTAYKGVGWDELESAD